MIRHHKGKVEFDHMLCKSTRISCAGLQASGTCPENQGIHWNEPPKDLYKKLSVEMMYLKYRSIELIVNPLWWQFGDPSWWHMHPTANRHRNQNLPAPVQKPSHGSNCQVTLGLDQCVWKWSCEPFGAAFLPCSGEYVACHGRSTCAWSSACSSLAESHSMAQAWKVWTITTHIRQGAQIQKGRWASCSGGHMLPSGLADITCVVALDQD